MTERVTLFEMAPRDGLQNEATMIATADKIELVDRLSRCGFSKIEVTSFVSPRWVPQLADAAEVMQGITRSAAVTYAALTPNMQGFERAMAARGEHTLTRTHADMRHPAEVRSPPGPAPRSTRQCSMGARAETFD